MKKQIAGLILFFSVAINAHASAILIDFEEVTPDYQTGLLDVQSQGYQFTGTTWFGSPPEYQQGPSGVLQDSDCFAWGGGCGSQISMTSLTSPGFAIYSFGSISGDISGTVIGGGSANLGVPIGTGDWLKLESFRVTSICPSAPCGYETVLLDDITVSAVPVPAAVWLFASALAGLGWLRRSPAA